MEASVPDRIEKRIHLRAPKSRVWKAISDSRQFGTWFGAEFEGAFVAGRRLKGRITGTKVDPEVAKGQEPFAGVGFEISVERVEPEHHFSFRWHPDGADEGGDFDSAPSTLVSIDLVDTGGGTQLTLIESGYSTIPLERRARAFSSNEGGWTVQMKLIEKFLATDA